MNEEIDQIREELRAVQGELRSNRPDLGSIVLSSIAVLIVDLQTSIIELSTPMADAMFGYITGELVGKSVHELVPEGLRDKHRTHVANYATRPESRQMGTSDMQLQGQKRDGTTFPVEIGLHPHAWNGRRYVVATLQPVRSSDGK